MKYMSLFSGIEAATAAWHTLGWEPVAFAEVEPFPCSVLAHHYPEVPNLGSVTDITDTQIKALGHIDIVVGGSPCQDLSVAAGKRKGLAGERLQGFTDNYTAIPYRKKPASECPDSPRYKALGNSMAVPVMRWIGEQIAAAALFHKK